jgi:aspartate carbamoyltransferase catalytic subunit
MSESVFRGPNTAVRSTEHPVADVANAARLAVAIPAKPDVLARLSGRHVLSASDLERETLLQVLRLAAHYEAQGHPDACPLGGRILSSVFVRGALSQTRLSFASAWLRLGGSILDFEESSARPNGDHYGPDELAELCSNYGNIAVLRTADSESLDGMVDYFRVPVINAGNGDDEHPTNAMADLYTLFKWRPDLLAEKPEHPLTIAISGDPARTRTIRSFLLILAKFPQIVKRILIMDRLSQPFRAGQREILEEAGLPIESIGESHSGDTIMAGYKRILPETDVIYVHHLVALRAPRMNFVEGIAFLRPEAMILCPELPGQVFGDYLNHSQHNAYFAQARGANYVRMALFCSIMGKLTR